MQCSLSDTPSAFVRYLLAFLDDSLFICKASSRPFPMGEALIYDSKPHYRR